MPHIEKLFSVEGKGFNIDFNEIFDLEDDTTYNYYPLHRKRVYLSIMDRVIDDMKYVFRIHPDFSEKYLTARIMIDQIEEGERDEIELQLIDIIKEHVISDDTLQHVIRDKVSEEYTITIETRNGEEELQFKDSYAKLLICVSFMCRLTVPLICAFMEKFDIKKEQDLTVRIFGEIFKVFRVDEEGETVDLPSKINRFITSSVQNTLYSDRVMWDYLKNIAVNDQLLIIDLNRKIIRDTIPKLDINRSVVSFLHVVIKQQVMYTFTQNIKITFKPISQIKTEGNDTGINPFTRMEMRLVNANEMSYVIEKEAIRNFIDKHKIRFSEEEHEYFAENIAPNQVQMRLIDYYVNGKDRINVTLCNREEYIWLLMITRQFLIEKNYKSLAAMIGSSTEPKENKKSFNRGKLIGEVLQSRSYRALLNRFPLVKEKLAENKMLISFIGDIMNTEFTCVKGFRDEEEDLQKFIDTEGNQRGIIQEILSFLERY
jgi:hypothetical protein